MSSTASRTNSPQQQRTRQKAAGHTPHASFSLPPHQPQHQQQQQQQLAGGQPINVQAQVQPPNARMSPASRYQSNLKVLRRRDPSIISIFDQFSHVCVYHHNGQKWEKHGYEGSMFLFEREDYEQRLYPEDDVTAHGGYLMLRSYPHFTNARLDAITNSSNPPTAEINNKFSVLYAYRNDDASSKDKGESQTIGLWTFAADGREPMMDVMLRLHAYIKKNLPYPDDYRYGPDRPPQPNPHLRVGESEYAAVAQQQQQLYSTLPMAQNGMSNINSNGPGAVGLSDVDKLFARFMPSEQYPNFGVPTQPQTQTQASSTGIGLLHAMFASASGGPTSTIASAPTPPTLPPTTIYQSQGAPLSFTSAGNYLQPQQTLGHGTYPMQLPSFAFPNVQTNHTHNPSPPSHLHQKQTSIPIHSPTPQSKVLPPPQVLSQNVIGSLLGLDRASAGGGDAGTGSGGENSAESPTHSSSRDGDNELELSLSSEDGGNSTSHGSSEEGGGVGLNVPPRSGIGGDTTPKPGYLGGDHLKGLVGATPSATSATTTSTTTTTVATSSTTATTAAKPNGTPEKKKKNANVKPRNERPLVPFESNSELWPYPRQPVDGGNPEPRAGAGDTSNNNDNEGSGSGEGGDIVELEWEDMSALSDLKKFERVRKAQLAARSKGAGATTVGGKSDSGLGAGAGQEGGRKKKEKKNKNKQQQQSSKREKLEAAMRAKEELEKSWDFPDVTAVQQRNVHNGVGVEVGVGNGTYGAGAGGGWDAGTGIGNGMMNLNGKTVPRPVAFHDDSLPATPSPVPSPVTPLSPTRSTTATRQAGYDHPSAHEGQLQTPHEQEEEGEEEVVSLSSSVNGSATKKKKKNRRKLGSSSSSKSKSGPPDGVGVPDDGSLFDVAGSNAGVDASVNGDGDGEVEERRLMKSLLSALSSSSSGKIVSGSVVERDVLVNEVVRLMKNEKFVDELWRGYNSEL
ncbi:hypothetical protein AN958_02800 [Leucoagaricus sp. SymC.cos]|nr:hypothetical protein AN958_02800 [Leucoagaricus sp. SymC.cos]